MGERLHEARSGPARAAPARAPSPVARRDAPAERAAARFAAGGPAPACLSCACGRACAHKSPPVASQGGGAPLPVELRAPLEARTGADLAGVRLHTGDDAAAEASSLSARAFTAGSDIVFGRDQYQPSSPTGRALIAHEIAHVVQGGDEIRRNGDGDDPADAGVAGVDPIAGVAEVAPEPLGPDAAVLVPYRPAWDPCAVEPDDELTNRELVTLLARTSRYLAEHAHADQFYDYLYLQRQLEPIRRRRLGLGEMWIARDVRSLPDRLFRIRSSVRPGFVEIVVEPLRPALDRRNGTGGETVVDDGQLRAYLRGAGIPRRQIDPAIEQVTEGGVAELDLETAMRLNAVEEERRRAGLARAVLPPFVPRGTGGMFGRVPGLPPHVDRPAPRDPPGVRGMIAAFMRGPAVPSRLANAVREGFDRMLGANQGLRQRYIGAIGEAAARESGAGEYLDLDALRPNARNFPDWDWLVRRDRAGLLQVKAQERGFDPGSLWDGFLRVIMGPHRPNVHQWEQEGRLAEVSALAGEPIDRDAAIRDAGLAVNDDNVEEMRAYVRRRLRTDIWRDLFRIVIADQAVTRDGTADGPRYTPADFDADFPVDGAPAIPDAVIEQVTDVVARGMIRGSGITTERVAAVMAVVDGHVRNVRAEVAGTDVGEGEILRRGVRRTMPHEIEVALFPERVAGRGAGIGVAASLVSTLIVDSLRAAFGADIDLGDEARGLGVGLPIAAGAGALDPILRGRLPSTRLGRGVGARAIGPGVGLAGAALTGPLTTFAMLATDPEHAYPAQEYAVMMSRAAIVGVAAFGLEAVYVGALAGTAIEPGGGTVVGAAVGLAIAVGSYLLVDALIGDLVEDQLRQWVGEPDGCGHAPPEAD